MIDDVDTARLQLGSIREPETEENESIGERPEESEKGED